MSITPGLEPCYGNRHGGVVGSGSVTAVPPDCQNSFCGVVEPILIERTFGSPVPPDNKWPILVTATKFRSSWPKQEGKKAPEPFLWCRMGEALHDTFSTDAHFVAYYYNAIERQHYRLRKESLEHISRPPVMLYLVIDVDSSAAHAGSGRATDEWWQAEVVKVSRLIERHPGAFVYRTRGGYRIVYRLIPARPIKGWATYYLRVITYLQSQFGILGDDNCKDWTRLFRLPHATRSARGKPEMLDVIGSVPGFWRCDDLPPPTKPQPKTKKSGRSRPSVVVRHLPPAEADADFVAALAATGEFKKGSLDALARALGGSLGRLGTAPGRVASIVHGAACGAGFDEHADSMATKAAATAERAASGLAAPQMCDLREGFPACAAEVAALESSPARERPILVQPGEARALIEAAVSAAMDRPGVTVLMPTVGSGKTSSAIRAIAASDKRALLFVATRALADECVVTFTTAGVHAAAVQGLSALRGASGQPWCRFSIEVDALQRLGAKPRKVYCTDCPLRDEHPTAGGRCPAFDRPPTDSAMVHIHQSVQIPHVLGGLDEDDRPLVVIDEPPPALLVVPFSDAVLAGTAARWPDLASEVAQALLPLHRMLVATVYDGKLPNTGDTLRQALLRVASPDDVDAAIMAASRCSLPEWTEEHCYELASAIRAGIAPTSAAHRRTEAALKVLGAMIEVSQRPDAPCFLLHGAPEDDDADFPERPRLCMAVPAPWTRSVRRYVEAGGCVVILDATADDAALASAIGMELHAQRLDVADAEGVTRQWVYWSSGPRSRHLHPGPGLTEPKASEIRGPLRDLAQRLSSWSARSALIVTDLPTETALRRELGRRTSKLVPDELLRLLADGIAVDVAHFGSLRGLDRWAGVDMVATLGDPWPGMEGAYGEAVALGVEPDAHWRRAMQRELVQAWGRLRAVFRTRPGHIIHYGAAGPDWDIAPQWWDSKPQHLVRGRPPAKGKEGQRLDPSGWMAERQRRGLTCEQHAAELGISARTYARRVAMQSAATKHEGVQMADTNASIAEARQEACLAV